jgi:hypothetical protein
MEVENLRDYMPEKGVHSPGLCRLERRVLLYFGLSCVEKYVRA